MQDAQLGQFGPRLEVCPRNQRLKTLEQPQLDTDLVAREFLRLANETNLPGRFRLNSRRLQHLGHSEYSPAPPRQPYVRGVSGLDLILELADKPHRLVERAYRAPHVGKFGTGLKNPGRRRFLTVEDRFTFRSHECAVREKAPNEQPDRPAGSKR